MRRNFDTSPRQDRMIRDLMQRSGLKTYTELINVSLTLFDWATTQKRAGMIVAAVDPKSRTYTELEMPALSMSA